MRFVFKGHHAIVILSPKCCVIVFIYLMLGFLTLEFHIILLSVVLYSVRPELLRLVL